MHGLWPIVALVIDMGVGQSEILGLICAYINLEKHLAYLLLTEKETSGEISLSTALGNMLIFHSPANKENIQPK
jgi:hypothetical protein